MIFLKSGKWKFITYFWLNYFLSVFFGGCFSSTSYKSATVEEGKGSSGLAVGVFQQCNIQMKIFMMDLHLKNQDFGLHGSFSFNMDLLIVLVWA